MILRGAYLLRRFLNSARRNEKQAQADRIRDQFYEKCWREAAQSCGGEFARVDDGAAWITLKAVPRPIYVDRNTNVIDSHASVRATDDKPATYQLIEELGAPVPDHVVLRIDAHKAALDFIESHGGAFVVKPASGTAGGIGVTANVRTAFELRHAMAWAGAYCPRVLLERQIKGDTYRLLYLNGNLLDCVLRSSPSLVGDGISTVRKLVEEENRLRLAEGFKRSQSLLKIDRDMTATLSAQSLNLNSVPKKGQKFIIKHVANDNAAKENVTMMDDLSESTIEIGRNISARFGLRLVGMDIMTPDISKTLEDAHGAVIDINGDPGFYYHYCKDSGRVRLAELILREVIKSSQAAREHDKFHREPSLPG
ncbi:hypothetical protein OGR47_04290 [Methylocystis sp. MJC1]|jgi:cyanophycin synthetase|uniref:hypothetical protein n=1 Tax=Methylocystis sp. MJC1 TaxID=2654282 RepID=UPI0013EAAAF6|nr:hypothetical protein [Methylocystis sp. MJC1]KAF2991225.1 Cyanophycin synthetase [Methylocystis sp. MJC1]MBU6526235.1 hypothetical protein [Methylocystis sp. MJC1]UZX12689.1 hypothetical protein OGR47_04290 [Methylocystis sp. MJC1]